MTDLVEREDQPREVALADDLLDLVEGRDVLIPPRELEVGEGEGREENVRSLNATLHLLLPQELEVGNKAESQGGGVSVVQELSEMLVESQIVQSRVRNV